MNNFDFPPQALARRTDAQAAKGAGQPSDGSDAGATDGSDAFGTLLKEIGGKDDPKGPTGKGIKEKAPAPVGARLTLAAAGGAVDETSVVERSDAGTSPSGRQAVEDLLQAVAGDAKDDAGQTQNPSQFQGAGVAYSLLEGLLPRVLGQKAQGTAVADGRTGKTPAGPVPGTAAAPGGAGKASPLPLVAVSVQAQETHFKPVVEGFTTKVVADGSGSAQDAKDPLAAMGAKLSGKPPAAPGPAGLVDGSGQTDVPAKAEADKTGDASVAKASGLDRFKTKLDAAIAGGKTGTADEPQSALPSGTLQRIAGAVLAEAQQMSSDAATRVSDPAAVQFLTSAKASDDAVRILSLQLHPADLGEITVKMRLAGDNLEMEMHVSNDETARLLKGDTDKLASLLKGSGYRPDIITIHTGGSDGVRQDGSGFSRQPAPQSQQEAFQRGSQQQSGGSAQRNTAFQGNREGGREDALAEGSTGGRSIGGVYL